MLETLREIEQSSGTDVFLLFSDGFVQSDPFVSVAIERLRMNIEQPVSGCPSREEPPPLVASLP